MLTGRRADLSLGPLADIIGGQEDKTNVSNAAVFKIGFVHMGQIPQDGENGQNVAFFYFFGALL